MTDPISSPTSKFILTSGEEARVEIIPRKQAIEILSRPVRRRTWFGQIYHSNCRPSRGPGPAADILNLGLYVGDKCRAVLRVGVAPWGNRPVIAAVGHDLASRCCYLSRLWAAGISHEDLVEFIRQANWRFAEETDKRFWYMLSLDSITGWLIENSKSGILGEGPPVAGRVYYEAGALYAGQTGSRSRPTRYVDPNNQQVKSLYQDGRNILKELNPGQVQLVDDGPKHRFVFILAKPGSLEYVAYRHRLPPHVREWTWGENGLGWIWPRLLVRLRQGFCDFQRNLAASSLAFLTSFRKRM